MKTLTQTSRRKFIKSASTAAAAFTIVPRHVLGGTGFTAPSEKLAIASIGVGGQGGHDAANFSKSGKAEITHLCDVDSNRMASAAKLYPKAKRYKDFREMLDKEHRHIDAVCVATPDHNHAIQALAAMQLGKHVFVEKPLVHDVWEARVLTDAARRYKVVTQMGNQGTSSDGARLIREWYEAGAIGDVHTVYVWTDRPVWPAGIPWPREAAKVPANLDWDLWLGTAKHRYYVEGAPVRYSDGYVVNFNWRGWWDFGTGPIGDMGCHLLDIAFKVLGLQHVQEVQASVARLFSDFRVRISAPDSNPPAAHVTMRFPKALHTKGPVTVHWMDGGITPTIPEELGLDTPLSANDSLLVGTKGKILTGVYGSNPRLLPASRQVKVREKYPRVANGHYAQWVEACLAGYGNKEVSSPFEFAGPLTEALLVANLAVRGADMNMEGRGEGRQVRMQWDHEAMRMTNFDIVNQFVKRDYRPGWELNYSL
ncbi:oxidoreductase [Cephaloticoccus primus]|uniref:Oxidoreductase n=1 Tax=Cephaloticoccus primus TaxID=1548207 RepID=A0A139SLS5_9BACT|nr:Gfo/Idh/MocA family oxidoreductase [Cephaloticoccus primus]KXU35434.1 oxidoreductase [Cephaloticoccus primus]